MVSPGRGFCISSRAIQSAHATVACIYIDDVSEGLILKFNCYEVEILSVPYAYTYIQVTKLKSCLFFTKYKNYHCFNVCDTPIFWAPFIYVSSHHFPLYWRNIMCVFWSLSLFFSATFSSGFRILVGVSWMIFSKNDGGYWFFIRIKNIKSNVHTVRCVMSAKQVVIYKLDLNHPYTEMTGLISTFHHLWRLIVFKTP